MVWDIYFTLGNFVAIKYCLDSATQLDILEGHVCYLMITVNLPSGGHLTMLRVNSGRPESSNGSSMSIWPTL